MNTAKHSIHLAFGGAMAFALLTPVEGAVAQDVTVYKSPTCGCCAKWVDHLRQNGFKVEINDVRSVDPIKTERGVPRDLASCHTAIVGDYVVEGHVPAEVLKRLLTERPRVAGIAVPGMPAGSPGMEGPTSQRYDVMSFDAKGNKALYESP